MTSGDEFAHVQPGSRPRGWERQLLARTGVPSPERTTPRLESVQAVPSAVIVHAAPAASRAAAPSLRDALRAPLTDRRDEQSGQYEGAGGGVGTVRSACDTSWRVAVNDGHVCRCSTPGRPPDVERGSCSQADVNVMITAGGPRYRYDAGGCGLYCPSGRRRRDDLGPRIGPRTVALGCLWCPLWRLQNRRYASSPAMGSPMRRLRIRRLGVQIPLRAHSTDLGPDQRNGQGRDPF